MAKRLSFAFTVAVAAVVASFLGQACAQTAVHMTPSETAELLHDITGKLTYTGQDEPQWPTNYLAPVRPEHGHAEGIVHGPADAIWPIIADGFADLAWWPIYSKVEDLSGHSNVGALRYLELQSVDQATGAPRLLKYKEELVTKDRASYTMEYKLLEADPPVPGVDNSNIITTVRLHPFEDGSDNTRVTWTSTVYGRPMNLASLATGPQSGAYNSGIMSLRARFGQQIGHVTVTPKNIANIVDEETFVRLLSFGRQAPEKRKVFLQISVGYYVKKTVEVKVDPRTKTADFSSVKPIRVPVNKGDEDLVVTVLSVDDELEFLGSAQTTLAFSRDGEGKVKTQYVNKAKLQGVSSGDITYEYVMDFLPGEEESFTAPSEAEGLSAMVSYFGGKIMALVARVTDPDVGKYEYREYPKPEGVDVPINEWLPKMVVGITNNEVLSATKISDMARLVINYVYNIVGNFMMKSPFIKDQWSAYFSGPFDFPDYVVNHWMEDAEFSRNYLTGNNPLEIQVLTDLAKVPAGFAELTPGGESLETLFEEKRLFFAEYPLMDWKFVPLQEKFGMVHYAPFVLLYNEKLADGTKRLNVAGIKLEPTKDDATVYHPNDGFPKRWLFAKIHACMSDHQYHQFIRHLGWAHLYAEPLSVAQHNAFFDHPEHPIGKLLKPHYEGTIGINYFARETLVDENYPFTESTFSVGATGGMTMVALWLKDQSLLDLVHPKYMEARGFDEAGTDGVQEYWFRDDGYKIHSIMSEYVRKVVDLHYASDKEVANDPALKAYYDELSSFDKARVKGIPHSPTTKKNLIEVIIAAIWPSSIIHSVVNYSQGEYSSYVPARPISLNLLMPEWSDNKDLDDEYIQRALPSTTKAHFQTLQANLLGRTPSPSYLTSLTNVFDANGEGPYEAVLRETQKELRALSDDIRARNHLLRSAGKPEYPFLDPRQVAASVNI